MDGAIRPKHRTLATVYAWQCSESLMW